jgi:outer membrane protein TolC
MRAVWRRASSRVDPDDMTRTEGDKAGAGAGRGGARSALLVAGVAAALAAGVGGCTPDLYRHQADHVAYRSIAQKQTEALGRTEPFNIETPAETLRRRLLLDQQLPYSTGASLSTRDLERIKQWPDDGYLKRPAGGDELVDSFATTPPVTVTLTDALQIAAHESRAYQAQKEAVFKAALQLDLESDAFRRTWSGTLRNLFQFDLEREVALDNKGHTDRQDINGAEYGGEGGLSQRLKNGLTFTGALGLDLVSLLTQKQLFSRGIIADVSATLPLMRGAGEFVVTEPLTQAERNVVYAIYTFEHFKHTFAVDVAGDYLAVLQQYNQVRNAESNYRSLVASTRRARRLADAGRLPEIQVDQSLSSELQARQRWVAAQESCQRRLDAFKVALGLPADAVLELDHSELDRLTERAAQAFPPGATRDQEGPAPAADAPIELVPPGEGQRGPYELDAGPAVLLALDQRLDLRVAVGQVLDAQRTVAVAADQLRADVTLLGTGSAGARRTLGSVPQNDAILRPGEGSYSVLLTINLPLERTAEQDTYRSSLIGLEQAVRGVQNLEDQVKLAVRNRLSELLEARESTKIQAAAVEVAKRRVESTNLFLEAGRAEIRDLLDAQDALLSAQNGLTTALVSYRLGELALQRDAGVLEVNEKGLWQEYTPGEKSE